ncbi:MAG TPA: hypothetical protein VLF18_11385 [Tahibacter sp.]|uniref:hypothetical protein n=1 Tax=Tahibacter sp. TaxID=2056211 RepID=UPI002BCFEB6F|nr:hypothetical protein [Tahibacter sp.]HSX60792.1 hypothetical protein [Tahibacter sp.]
MDIAKFIKLAACAALAAVAAPASAEVVWVEGFGQDANYEQAYADAVAMGESDCIDFGGTPTISTLTIRRSGRSTR